MSGSRTRSTVRLLRASGSSSTTTVRIFVACSSARTKLTFFKRHGQQCLYAGILIVQSELKLVAVQVLETSAYVRDADSGLRVIPVLRQIRAVIVNAECKPAARAKCRHTDPPSAGLFRDAVFHGILDKRLQNQAGNLNGGEFLWNVKAYLKALGKPQLLNVQVLFEKLHLFAKRHLLPVRMFNYLAEKVTERCDCGDGGIISPLADQSGDRVEGIEKKVRLDLPAQGFQLSFGEQFAKAGGLDLLTS